MAFSAAPFAESGRDGDLPFGCQGDLRRKLAALHLDPLVTLMTEEPAALREGFSRRRSCRFVVVLFLGMAVLDFPLRQVMEQSLKTPGVASVQLLRRDILLASVLSLAVATLLAALAGAAICQAAGADRGVCQSYRGRAIFPPVWKKAIWTRFSAVAHALDVTASRLEHSFSRTGEQPQRADRAARQHAGSGHRDQPQGAGELVQCGDATNRA